MCVRLFGCSLRFIGCAETCATDVADSKFRFKIELMVEEHKMSQRQVTHSSKYLIAVPVEVDCRI
jgi:hypothetical protein